MLSYYSIINPFMHLRISRALCDHSNLTIWSWRSWIDHAFMLIITRSWRLMCCAIDMKPILGANFVWKNCGREHHTARPKPQQNNLVLISIFMSTWVFLIWPEHNQEQESFMFSMMVVSGRKGRIGTMVMVRYVVIVYRKDIHDAM
jgi:hypothetical protein